MVDRQSPLKDIAEILLDLSQSTFERSEPTSHVTDFRCEIADCAVLDISKQMLHTCKVLMLFMSAGRTTAGPDCCRCSAYLHYGSS